MYSIISSIRCTAFVTKATKEIMSYLGMLGMQTGAGIVQDAWDALDLFNQNEKNDRRQLKQAQGLTDIQKQAQLDLMNQSNIYAMDMYNHSYDKTKPLQQVKNLKEAGLNPALMYGMGGAGGTTGQMGNISGSAGMAGSAADAAAMQQAQTGRAAYRDWETDRKSTRLNSSHSAKSRMPSSA